MNDLRHAVEAAIQSYEDTFEADKADWERYTAGRSTRTYPDYRKRNAGIDLDKLQLVYAPFATYKEVPFHYEDTFASIPWRALVPIVVYKETPKLLMVGYDSGLNDLRSYRYAGVSDPGDPVDVKALHVTGDMMSAFKQISKAELGKRIFRTAQEAFDSLPEAHKLPLAEMERRYAEAELSRDARRYAEDEARRALPCARCQQPIGPERAYTHHLGYGTDDKTRRFVHLDCRKCESCGATITGEYVEVAVTREVQPQATGGGWSFYSGDRYLDKLYYHAACAYKAGVKPTNGGLRHAEYGFYTHDASYQIHA